MNQFSSSHDEETQRNMEISLVKCFICDKSIETKEKSLTGSTVDSAIDGSLALILEKCLQQEFIGIDDEIFCEKCSAKIQNYDQLVRLSREIESELYECYKFKSINSYYLIEEIGDAQSMETFEENDTENVQNDQEDSIVLTDNDSQSVDEKNIELEIEYLSPSQTKIDKTKGTKKRGRRKKGSAVHARKKGITSTRANKKNSTKIDKFKCDECGKVFNDLDEHNSHVETFHANKKHHECSVCGQLYTTKSALSIHIGLHKGISPHECDVCNKRFATKSALSRHMPLHTGEHPYQCDKCGKQFIHYSSFHMHQLAHDNIRLKKCDICGMELMSSSHLKRHLRVHSGEKPFACPECGQKFAQRYNMTTHLKAHQGIHRARPKPHYCNHCGEAFNKLEKLKEHISIYHFDVPETIKEDENTETTTIDEMKYDQIILQSPVYC